MSFADFIIIALAGPLGFYACDWILERMIGRAHATGALDHPTDRGSHSTPTPRVGGLGVAGVVLAAALLGWLALWLAGGAMTDFFQAVLGGLILGGAVAVGLGYWDDVRNLPVGPKLMGQIVAAALGAAAVGGLGKVGVLGLYIPLPNLIGVPIVFAGLFWMMNVCNFMDGSDGMLSVFTVAILTGFAIAMGRWMPGREVLILILAAYAGAILAFHRRNVWLAQERKTFMGDCGSQFSGLALGMLALVFFRESFRMDLTAPFALFFPFLFDTGYTIVRRYMKGANVFQAHHEHLYQRHLDAGASHRTVRWFWCVIMAIHVAIAGVITLQGPDSLAGWVAALATPLPMGLYWRYVRRLTGEKKGAGANEAVADPGMSLVDDLD